MNQIIINGTIDGDTIIATRTSGATDIIPIEITPELNHKTVTVTGTLHTYNTPDKKLHIFIEPQTITAASEPQNIYTATGYVCRTPKYRTTPNGKRITEITLAIPHPNYPSDYIPCIAWGSVAETAKELTIGTEITITGRIQSRTYTKQEQEKTTIEVSINNLLTTQPQKE